MLERGFHAVSIEAVARGAGITRPIVYGHFDDLAGAAGGAGRARDARALLARTAPGRPTTTCSRRSARYLEAVRTDPDTWRLVLVPQEGAPRLLHERIAAGRAAVVERLAQALARGTGLPDPELTAHMLSRLRRRGRAPDARGLRRGAHPRAHPLVTLDKRAAVILPDLGAAAPAARPAAADRRLHRSSLSAARSPRSRCTSRSTTSRTRRSPSACWASREFIPIVALALSAARWRTPSTAAS